MKFVIWYLSQSQQLTIIINITFINLGDCDLVQTSEKKRNNKNSKETRTATTKKKNNIETLKVVFKAFYFEVFLNLNVTLYVNESYLNVRFWIYVTQLL